MASDVSVAIIGLGPRGLTVLDRFLEGVLVLDTGLRIDLHLFDPGKPGRGVHSDVQPDYLLINTIAGMVTLFPHRPLIGQGPWEEGPSLPEWMRRHGYRRYGTVYRRDGCPGGEEISDHDYVPRRLLGEYLGWYYERLLARLPATVRVTFHQDEVVDIVGDAGGPWQVVTADGARVEAELAFVASGHVKTRMNASETALATFAEVVTKQNPLVAFHGSAYPLSRLRSIPNTAVVAVQGLGLTAHDVIADLTAGRGGRFSGVASDMKYIASGDEPKILIFSRSGIPFSARGVYQKAGRGLYRPRFFTEQFVEARRAAKVGKGGSGQIDFEAELLPALLKELVYAHRTASSGAEPDPATFQPSQDEMRYVWSLLSPFEGATMDGFSEFRAVFIKHIEDDLREAESGNVHGPVKATIEVLRDSRVIFRKAVEYGGLTPNSQAWFDSILDPAINRVTFGPPMQRNYEMLALLRAGNVDLAAGPDAIVNGNISRGQFEIAAHFAKETKTTWADVLVKAQLARPDPGRDASRLTTALLQRGTIRQFRNGEYVPGGIDIDRQNHPIRREGVTEPTVWFVGYPVEGPHYFTHALPLPGGTSRHVADADKCVLEALQWIGTRSSQSLREEFA